MKSIIRLRSSRTPYAILYIAPERHVRCRAWTSASADEPHADAERRLEGSRGVTVSDVKEMGL